MFKHVLKFQIQSYLKAHCRWLCPQPWLARRGKVTVVVWDSWSHVCSPVLDWPCALRWWMAADCSDSLGARLVCCVPHNGLTHRESTASFSVHLSAVLLEHSVWLLCCLCVLMETVVFSYDCVFFLHCSFFIPMGMASFPSPPCTVCLAAANTHTVLLGRISSFPLTWRRFSGSVKCTHYLGYTLSHIFKRIKT